MLTTNDINKQKSVCMNAVVSAVQDITPHLRRISLKHELLKGIGPLPPGVHFKIYIPLNKGEAAVLPDMSSGRAYWPDERTKPIIRTYTIRSIDRVAGILAVEFVLHGDNGPASAWAANASLGDTLGIGVKISGKINETSEWYLFAGDETALPAISAMLEALPPEATGVALLEVENETDTFTIDTDGAIEICWLIRNGTPPERSKLLFNAVKSTAFPKPGCKSRFIWIAGEGNMVKATRKYLAEHLHLSPDEFRATVYWNAGRNEGD
jgi:NADPH-dependent ferric siderophore reductase